MYAYTLREQGGSNDEMYQLRKFYLKRIFGSSYLKMNMGTG